MTLRFLLTAFAATTLPGCGKKPDPAPATRAMSDATDPPAAVASGQPDTAKLTGKWLRPDGGYILEIRQAAAAGKLEAFYFNPGPINVSRAAWQVKDGGLQVFVELRDTNYPGCTYTLDYSARDDRMTGIYHQAALGENFTVEFTRQNP